MNIQNAYDEWAETYDTDENLTRELDHEVTGDLLADLRFDTILELGCGTGKNTGFLAYIGKMVLALDFSPGMLTKARQKVQVGNVCFAQADITRVWPCTHRAFNLIACNLVLEHVEDLSHIFSEAGRKLRPGGKFMINELHPFRQYMGKRARYYRDTEIIEVEAAVHHISDFVNAAMANGLTLKHLKEHWHKKDRDKPPRIVSLMFEK